MKISTLICAYVPTIDYVHLFERAFESVWHQSRRPDEIIVVLDEPGGGMVNDALISCLEYYADEKEHQDPNAPELRYFIRDKKEGLAAAKNFGLQYCTGDYITYCDVDDEWMECKLEVQTKCAEENPWYHVIGTLAWDRDADSVLRPNCFAPGQYHKHAQIRERLPHENVMCHGSVMINREELMKFDGPYRDVRGAEDWDLWQRMMGGCCVFHNIPERLYIYSLGTSVER